MRLSKKHVGLILASFIALSFNSHFAQAAKKTQDILAPAKVYAFKKTNQGYVPLTEVKDSSLVVKKTGVRLDRQNVYIGGYLVNSSGKPIRHVRVFPTFLSSTRNSDALTRALHHDELYVNPGETRRFVIMRPINQVKDLIRHNIPLEDNCILNCREL